jgi:protein-disulfide isomerase
MSYRLRSSWLAIAALLLLVPIGACNCNGSSSTTAKTDADKSTEESAAVEPDPSDEAEQADAPKDAPSADLYPGMNFGALSSADRIKFVDIAKAEVCPCPDAAESLHECLQEEATACGLSKQVAGMAAMGIRQGLNETDILNRVAEFVEAARTKHDFTLDDTPLKGPAKAPVTIVEFADFQCPHCKVASGVMDEIAQKYGDKVAVYFKQFPLQSHATSTLAAKAAVAAQKQDKFWPMHDLIFEHQTSLSPEKFMTFARRLGMNVAKFKQDLNSQDIASQVARDRKEGNQAGITGTPAIFIDGHRYMSTPSLEALSYAIDAKLAESKSGSAGDDEGAGSDENPESDEPESDEPESDEKADEGK